MHCSVIVPMSIENYAYALYLIAQCAIMANIVQIHSVTQLLKSFIML